MKNLFPLLLLLLTTLAISSCNKEKSLLNDVEGEWLVTSVDYIQTDGATLTTDLANSRLTFSACSVSDNKSSGECELTLTRPDGSQLFFHYQVLKARTAGMRTLQITGTDRNSIEEESSIAHQVIAGSFGFEVSGNTLSAVSGRNGSSFSINGAPISEGSYTLRRP